MRNPAVQSPVLVALRSWSHMMSVSRGRAIQRAHDRRLVRLWRHRTSLVVVQIGALTIAAWSGCGATSNSEAPRDAQAAIATPVCGSGCPPGECESSTECAGSLRCRSCPGYTDGSICKMIDGPMVVGRCVPTSIGTSCQQDSDCDNAYISARCFLGYCDLISLPDAPIPTCSFSGYCVFSSDCCSPNCCVNSSLGKQCMDSRVTTRCLP